MVSPEPMAVLEPHQSTEEAMEITESHDSLLLKRKVSSESDHDGLPKRSRYGSSNDEREQARKRSRSPGRHSLSHGRRSISPERRSRSPERNRRIAEEEPVAERRPPVTTQEDRKRGRRLFGGLLSTLNQGPSNAHQKRRLEIEKRQQERMQKQEVENDQRRTERLAQLRTTRIREQIIFDEEVMRNRHIKKLALARYLQTRAEPKIYYLPWRCTDEQLDIIDKQRQAARDFVQREESDFEKRRKWHVDRHGVAKRPRPPSPPREQQQPSPTASPKDHAMEVDSKTGEKAHDETAQEGMSAVKSTKNDVAPPNTSSNEETRISHHDDVGDIVEHDGEDMVIY